MMIGIFRAPSTNIPFFISQPMVSDQLYLRVIYQDIVHHIFKENIHRITTFHQVSMNLVIGEDFGYQYGIFIRESYILSKF